ncbi:MAG: hypothetical protein ACRDHL_08435 [Candidatus Promineifilaceae bacterium]
MSGSILPYLLGGLLLLVLFTSSITAKAWREAKRSPYFFLRVQARKRMQRNMLATLAFMLVALGVGLYSWRAPADLTARVARISHAKPAANAPAAAEDVAAAASPEVVEINMASLLAGVAPAQAAGLVERPLPAQFDQHEPTVELSNAAELGQISFSIDITDDYQAIEAARRFTAGFFTLYATFSYENMEDGLVWSWVWRHNSEVVDGGNQVWSYGEDGPGYVYFRPDEGFKPGEYALDLWVNDKLLSQSNFLVSDGVAANN